jgi:hypothetical protein
MKIIFGEPTKTYVKLKAELVNGDLVISDVNAGWSLIALRVEDGKISLVRYRSVGNKNYNTEKDTGKLVEVPE